MSFAEKITFDRSGNPHFLTFNLDRISAEKRSVLYTLSRVPYFLSSRNCCCRCCWHMGFQTRRTLPDVSFCKTNGRVNHFFLFITFHVALFWDNYLGRSKIAFFRPDSSVEKGEFWALHNLHKHWQNSAKTSRAVNSGFKGLSPRNRAVWSQE